MNYKNSIKCLAIFIVVSSLIYSKETNAQFVHDLYGVNLNESKSFFLNSGFRESDEKDILGQDSLLRRNPSQFFQSTRLSFVKGELKSISFRRGYDWSIGENMKFICDTDKRKIRDDILSKYNGVLKKNYLSESLFEKSDKIYVGEINNFFITVGCVGDKSEGYVGGFEVTDLLLQVIAR